MVKTLTIGLSKSLLFITSTRDFSFLKNKSTRDSSFILSFSTTFSTMQELNEAAIAYYNNGSTDQQNLAWQFFLSMDGDGNGRVSFQEYTDFLCRTTGLAWVRREMFQELDRNRDGQLDFWEVLTLYYVARTRTIGCRTCLQPLIGLYFTCVTCFESQCVCDTFDLCVNCYMRRNYNHPHRVFLDSFVLLRSKRSHPPLVR